MADTVSICNLYQNYPQSHKVCLDELGPEHIPPGNGS